MTTSRVTTVADLSLLCRSKNAGPFLLTLDVVCRDDEAFARLRDADVLTVETISRLYSVEPSDVRIVAWPLGRAFKITIPRLVSSGDVGDTDVYGAQQHVPLMELPVPD
jgi:hypothetical protein